MITIRKATKDDLEIILSMHKKLREFELQFSDEFLLDGMDGKKGRKYFESCLSGYKSITLIAQEETLPVGFSITHLYNDAYARKNGKVAVLDYLFIDKDFRTKGVGSMLVNETKKILKKRKMPRFKVVAMAENVNAINFYKKHGFLNFATILEMDL